MYDQVLYLLGTHNELSEGRSTISISYRKFLWLLVMESGDLDQIPYSERTVRCDELRRIKVVAPGHELV